MERKIEMKYYTELVINTNKLCTIGSDDWVSVRQIKGERTLKPRKGQAG